MKTIMAFFICILASSAAFYSYGKSAESENPPDNKNLTSQKMFNLTIALQCHGNPGVPAADYVGEYKGVENGIPLPNLVQDIYCSDLFKNNQYPNGYVTIFGSSRIDPDTCDKNDPPCTGATKAEYAAIYEQVRKFAYGWTQYCGKEHPILTGAGPGLMKAGSQGASQAGGPSIGYTTYYDRIPNGSVPYYYGGDPTKAFNQYIDKGLIFSSVALREDAMIKHSAAIVIAPGGAGTEWEIFQVLETVKSHQLMPVPVYLLGDRNYPYWKSLSERIQSMIDLGTVSGKEITLVFYADEGKLISDLGEKICQNPNSTKGK